MKKSLLGVLLVSILFFSNFCYAGTLPGNIETYKLENGLTVILYQDQNASDVFGCVTVKAGSYHEPLQSTGLAHYLEHVLFKGTQELGTTNWEAEKPYYDEIIELFEQLRQADSEDKKKEISKQINELSIKAGQYTINNEFSNLVQSMGGKGLNAGTGYDQTSFYNSFPSYQIERWLELYSGRFVNPVFRGFQAELENVYEEKNMYSDNPFSVMEEELEKHVYGSENPYGRSIIGYTEHLKNPSLKDLIKFYNEEYVPGNMALILSGNINIEDVKPLIQKTFGSWKSKSVPETKVFEQKAFEKNEKVNVRLTPYPEAIWVYKGVKAGEKDEVALDLLCKVLSNRNQTGILDKYVLNGDIQYISVGTDTRKYGGTIQISAVPTFDMNTYKFNSFTSIHKIVEKSLESLVSGNLEDWLFKSVKMSEINNYKLAIESNRTVGLLCSQAFVNESPVKDELTNYTSKINSITKDDLIRVAKNYLDSNYLSFYSTEGNETSNDHIKKPDLEPIVPATGSTSVFAKKLESIAINNVQSDYIDFKDDVKTSELAKGVKLFYTENKVNDVFSLTVKFGAGSREVPAIGLASELMNSAGVMAQFDANQVKKEFSRLGCSYSFDNDANYTYVTLQGNEQNLEEACRLLSKLYIIPALDEKQMNRLLGGTIGNRSIEKKSKNAQVSALQNYQFYGDKSPYLDRLTAEEIQAYTLSSLAAEFTKVTQYETSVHYTGKTPFNELVDRLHSSLAFPANLQPSNSPSVVPFADQPDNIIYFVNNKDAAQSDIYIFIKADDYEINEDPYIDAFNQYFSGGFNGLVIQELRELRSYAYTASASYLKMNAPGKTSGFVGYIGTQSDNTVNALREFLRLINEMPQKPERINNVKNYLLQESGSSKPSFRYVSQRIESLEKKGYKADPGLVNKDAYESITFDDILNFYKEHIKGKSISVSIVGNKSAIDMKSLSELGNIKNVSVNKLFK